MKNKRKYVYGALGIAILAIVGFIASYFMIPKEDTATLTSNMSNMDMSGGKSDTYKKYAALKGEEYDKAFLSDMVIHHTSAMNMAEEAQASAKHQEIKDLASNINSTQGQEVGKMNSLQKQWGYTITSGHMMAGGDRDSMMNMAMEDDELKGLTGDDFDKKFLEVMIKHHQDAVDMSKPAASNASRQEIKDLAQGIMNAQTKEIVQMQLWQSQWGYVNA